MTTNIYWDGATATYAGPVAPSLPTPFWLDNSTSPYILHYWLAAPEFQYVPLGQIDPATNAFSLINTTPISHMTITDLADGTFVFTPANGTAAVNIRQFDIDKLPDSNVWASGDTLAKENLSGVEQEADADTYIANILQSGPQSNAVLSALTPTNSSDEIVVGNSLPATANPGDIFWHEIGLAPNRQFDEYVFMQGAWQTTTRSFDEATQTFVFPNMANTNASATSPMAVFYQQEPRGVSGGDLPGGGWRDRILNTQQHNSLSGVTLNAATGEVSFAASSTVRNFLVRSRAALGFYGYPQGFVAVHHQTRIATTGGVQQIIGESSFGSNQDGSSQSGNTTHASLEGVLSVPATGGTYVLQHVNNWSFSSWSTKQGEAVGRGMDLVSMTTLGGPEVYATLSLQEIA